MGLPIGLIAIGGIAFAFYTRNRRGVRAATAELPNTAVDNLEVTMQQQPYEVIAELHSDYRPQIHEIDTS